MQPSTETAATAHGTIITIGGHDDASSTMPSVDVKASAHAAAAKALAQCWRERLSIDVQSEGLDAETLSETLRNGSADIAIVTRECAVDRPCVILNAFVTGANANAAHYSSLAYDAALSAAAPDFAIGSEGGGTGALTHRWKGGLGSASAVLDCGITIGALVVVNALGSVTAGSGRQFWAAPYELGDEFGGLGLNGPYDAGHEPQATKRLGEATTIAIVATDAALDKAGLTRLATAAQDGMARAILPSHTPFDGDLVFAVSTGARALPDPAMTPFALGHAAACVLARAIARGVHAASPRPGDLQPCWSGAGTGPR